MRDRNDVATLVKAYLGWDDEDDGQGLVEYGLIIVLVSIVVVLTLTALGSQLNVVFNNIKGKLTP